MNCLQYHYENPEDAEKYKIECKEKIFDELNIIETFTSEKLNDYMSNNYSSKAFVEDSPFKFSEQYKNLSNEEICKSTDINLGPQQKFMGQIMSQNTNFNNILVYHGLGSGKTCTSIVIGESLKNSSNKNMIYTVPAPLVEQYFEEITGEIRNGKFFSCPSFCIVKNGGKTERDFYVSDNQNRLLSRKFLELERNETKLLSFFDNPTEFKKLQDEIDRLKRDLQNYQKSLRSKILRTFEIVSHQTFVNQLYKTDKNKQFIKGERLTNFNSALFTENGLLVIDEIQRLVSDSGTFYKKLYNSLKYYFHPKLKLVLMSATPIYDNPYELALTMNLLRPRLNFPLDKNTFFDFFIGEYNEEEDSCKQGLKKYINDKSCIINKDLLRYLCSGYVSYFKGGNPNAYPYKRIITLEHVFSNSHKSEYLDALRSDVKKDKIGNREDNYNEYENILLGNVNTESEDKISGMYVTTQQYSNIYFPKASKEVNSTVKTKQIGLEKFKSVLKTTSLDSFSAKIEFIKRYSTKFASIIELSLASNGPVFIFSNWLSHGVEPLAAILEMFGLVSFEKEDKGKGKFFVWSSDTKAKDKDNVIIKKARNTFNSFENKDGSKLKIILGTRSVMEGVSFKNVKQVHITEPWWNESRIEQILARASRYCSHSSLNIEEQYVDIYRHYSTFAGPDEEAKKMLLETIGKEDFKDLHVLGFDVKMFIASDKKFFINTELNNILKEVSIDFNLNEEGNLVRLEENISPITGGKYQLYYKNPSTGRKYIRDGLENIISFEDIISRKYSFPNDKELQNKFIEAGIQDSDILTPYEDSEILEEPIINKDLIMKENTKIYLSDKTFDQLDIQKNIKDYFKDINKKFNLLPALRKNYFNEQGGKNITFKNNDNKRFKLIQCIKELSNKNLVSDQVKKEISKEFQRDKTKDIINSKVMKIIFDLKLYPEQYLEELLTIGIENPKLIDEIIKNIS